MDHSISRNSMATGSGGGRAPRSRLLWTTAGVSAILVLAGWAVHGAGRALAAPPDTPAGSVLRAVLIAVLLVSVVALTRRWLLGRPWSDLGLSPLPTGWRPLLWGAVLWLVPTVAILGLATVAGWAQAEGAMAPGELALLAAALVPALLMAALAEELAFRGYVQRGVTAALGIWAGVFAQAALFAVFGAALAASFDALLSFFLLGVLLGVLRNYTGTVWAGVGVSAATTATGLFLGWAGVEPAEGSPGAVWALYAVVPFVVVLIAAVTRPHLFLSRASPADLLEQAGSTGGQAGLMQQGILYDVGSSYMPGQSSRRHWRPEVVRRELRVIRAELHCTAVTLFGRDSVRLEECAEMALEQGLSVWIQPRTVNSTPRELLDHLSEVAPLAERLRRMYPGRVGLNVGCEISVFTSGCIPGRNFGVRSTAMRCLPLFPLYSMLLNRLLRRAAAVAREHFQGPLTYGAGTWESVDWGPFDVIGLDYYWDLTTHANFLDHLRTFYRHGKPVIIAEFGCCAYAGAELRGGGGAEIMEWRGAEDRRVRGGHVRDEQVQADYIGSLIEVFAAEGLYGAFVCMFIEGDCTSSPDPRRDLDRASLGVVKPYPPEEERPADEGHWEPKVAFHEIARRYGAAESGSSV